MRWYDVWRLRSRYRGKQGNGKQFTHFWGKYTNSSTNPVNNVLKARQLFQCDQQLVYNNPSSSYLTNWIHVEEVKR